MGEYISVAITAAALTFGGVVDYKRREIPDAVSVILIAIGVTFEFSLFWRIIGLVIPAVLILTVAKIAKSEIPGGDFKLLCSMGFACGLQELAAVMLLAAVGAMIYSFIKRLPLKRNIPLCSYIAPAYIAFQIIAFTIA